MAKYRKKSIVIDAEKWLNLRTSASTGVAAYSAGNKLLRKCRYCGKILQTHGWIDAIDTLEGGHLVCPGDFILTGIKGEKYPIKNDIFEQTYEAVDE